nr:pentatricopeptide repeat-containing protein At2g26790, mitochondrial-like [Ipomoea batatas]
MLHSSEKNGNGVRRLRSRGRLSRSLREVAGGTVRYWRSRWAARVSVLSSSYEPYSMLIPAIRFIHQRKIFISIRSVQFKSLSMLAQLSSYLSDSSSSSDGENSNGNVSSSTLVQDFSKVNSYGAAEMLYKLRNEPNSALSYFRQIKECGFQYDLDTYVAIIRILCHWGMNIRLDSILLEVIKSEKETLGFDVSDLLEALMEGLHAECPNSIIRMLDALVKAYVSMGMFDKSIDILFTTRRRGFGPSLLSCNFLMNRLVDCGKLDMAVAVYKQLKRLGFNPNVYTYGIVIKALCRNGNLEEAASIFGEMEEMGVTPNEFTYSAYLEGLCLHGLSSLGYEVLREWKGANIPLDVYPYTVVVRGFVNERKFSEVEAVFLDMEEQGLVPDDYTYGALTDSSLFSILQSLCQNGMASEVVEQFNSFKELGIFLDEVVYNIAIHALCKLGKLEEAMKLLDEMKKNGLKPDVVAYNVLLGGFSRNGFARETLHPTGLYEGTRFLIPTTVTYNVIIEGLCMGHNVEEAEKFLDNLNSKSEENYAAMINGYCQSGNTSKAYKLFLKLSKQGISIKRSSCLKLLASLCSEREYDRAMKLFEIVLCSDDGPCTSMYSRIISALCRDGDMKRARWIFDNMLWRGITPDVIIYTMMLNGYCRVNCLREAHSLFADMKSRGISPDVITYTVMLDGHSKGLKRTQSSSCAGGNKGGSKIASDLWCEMKEMKLTADAICYTVLIDSHCKSDSLDDAIQLFNEMIDRGVEPDNVTYTALLCGFFKHGHIGRAVSLVHEMKGKGIEPDSLLMKAIRVQIKH